MHAGYMQACRAEWQAAASVLQAAVRRWQSRRALVAALASIHRGVRAVIVLQAAYRGRPHRHSFLRIRAAAITAQVCTSSQYVARFADTNHCNQGTLAASTLAPFCPSRSQQLIPSGLFPWWVKVTAPIPERCPFWCRPRGEVAKQ